MPEKAHEGHHMRRVVHRGIQRSPSFNILISNYETVLIACCLALTLQVGRCAKTSAKLPRLRTTGIRHQRSCHFLELHFFGEMATSAGVFAQLSGRTVEGRRDTFGSTQLELNHDSNRPPFRRRLRYPFHRPDRPGRPAARGGAGIRCIARGDRQANKLAQMQAESGFIPCSEDLTYSGVTLFKTY